MPFFTICLIQFWYFIFLRLLLHCSCLYIIDYQHTVKTYCAYPLQTNTFLFFKKNSNCYAFYTSHNDMCCFHSDIFDILISRLCVLFIFPHLELINVEREALQVFSDTNKYSCSSEV